MNKIWSIINILIWLLWPMLWLTRRSWDILITVVFTLTCSWRRKTQLPPVFNPILILPAKQLAFNIRIRKMTSVEVVKAYITRLGEINPILNAIVQENFQGALYQAQKIDERIQQGYLTNTLSIEYLKENEPLLGVPFTVKETIAVQGFPQTAGLVARQNHVATQDADVVSMLKRAGAIFLASTNVSELGMWWESDNRLYGRTNNPYDVRRTPGGSSGGECALMCACGTPISVGSDTGGSIRIPAFFSGVFGHKPSEGLTSVKGCHIHDDKKYSSMQVVGPIAKHADDLPFILSVITQPNLDRLHLQKPVDIGSLNIYSMKDDGDGLLTTKVTPALVQIQEMISQHFLHTYDVNVAKVYVPEMSKSFQIFLEKMSMEYGHITPMYEQLADNQGEINVWTELTRSFLGRGRHTLPSLAQALHDLLVEDVKNRLAIEASPKDVTEPRWKILHMKIQRLLGDNGILLYPSHPTLAPYHRESYYRPLNFSYTAVFNALGFPVTQVPLGLHPGTGLPLGIQIVGGKYQDRLTLAVAKDLENRFGGWKCPSKIL